MTRIKDKPHHQPAMAVIPNSDIPSDRDKDPHSPILASSKRLRNNELVDGNASEEGHSKKIKVAGKSLQTENLGLTVQKPADGADAVRDEQVSPPLVRSSSRIRFTLPDLSQSPILTPPENPKQGQAIADANNKTPSCTRLRAGFHSPESHNKISPSSFLMNNISPEFRKPGLITSTQQGNSGEKDKQSSTAELQPAKSTRDKLKRFMFEEKDNSNKNNKASTAINNEPAVSAISKIIGASGLDDITDQDLELD